MLQLLTYLLIPAAIVSGIHMANATNDGTYFYLGLSISIGVCVVLYIQRKRRSNAKPISMPS